MQERTGQQSARNRFAEVSDQVIDLLEQSVAVAAAVVPLIGEDRTGSLPDTFRERAKQVREQEFVIVVVGEIKRGKSAFLNAMMQRHVLTMDVEECTATVNLLRQPRPGASQSPDEAVVHFNDGRDPDTVPVSELKDYTSDQSNLGKGKVAELINRVEVFVESRFLENNVILVDTPGSNTTTAKHLQITQGQIDRSHAAIFLVDAQTQVTRSDREFLEDVYDDVAGLFVVVNRIDVVPESDLDRVLQRVATTVVKTVGDGPAIHGVYGVCGGKALVGRTGYAESMPPSVLRQDERTKLADQEFRSVLVAQSRIEAFENALEEYLFHGGKARDLLRSPVLFVQGETGRLIDKLHRQTEVIDDRFDLTGLELQVEKIKRVIADRKHELDGITKDLSQELSAALSKVENAFEEKRGAADASLLDEIRACGDSYEALKDNWVGGGHLATLPERKTVALQRQMKRMMDGAVRRVLNQAGRGVMAKVRDDLGEIRLDLPEIDVALPERKIDEGKVRKIQDLSQQIAAEEGKLYEMEGSNLSKEEYEELKAERDRWSEARVREIGLLGSRPEAQTRTEFEQRHEWRGGLLGIFNTVLTGKRVVEVPKYHRDDQAGKAYDERLDQINKQMQEKMIEIEKRVASAKETYDSDRLEQQGAKHIAQVTENYRRERERLEQQDRSERKGAEQRAVAAARGQLVGSFRSAADALGAVVADTINRTQDMAEGFLAASMERLDAALTERGQELTRLTALKEEKESERDGSRERITSAMQQLETLRGEASRLAERLAGDGTW